MYIFQDWSANNSYKAKIILALFRLAQVISRRLLLKCLFFPYLVFYKCFVESLLCVELPWKMRLGRGARLYHGFGLVINPFAVIGDNCTLRHCTTIGNGGAGDRSPVIGNNVDIGCNVCIIGGLRIGDNVSIGAGTVVVKDIPDNAVVVGNPGRVVKMKTKAADVRVTAPLERETV